MEKSELSSLIDIKSDEDKNIAIQQYQCLVDDILKTKEIRESSNNFWIGANLFIMAAIGHFLNIKSSPYGIAFILTMLGVGIVICFAWFSSLSTIKKMLQGYESLMGEIEKVLPIKIFKSFFYYSTGSEKGGNSLTAKEMLVPLSFLSAYIYFSVFLILHRNSF